jgi:hypothetical protein
LEREKLMNSALEMYDFIIGSLLQSEMTSRQSTLFRFVTRALFAIPGATIHTFHDILQNGPKKYQAHIDTLDETTRQFFASDFNNPQFKQTTTGHRPALGRARQPDIFADVFKPAIEDRFLFGDQHARKSHPHQCRERLVEGGRHRTFRAVLSCVDQSSGDATIELSHRNAPPLFRLCG